MPPAKFPILAHTQPAAHNHSHSSHDGGLAEPSPSDNDGVSDNADDDDDDDELANPTRLKSKKTQKRKYRATDTTNFGATLQSLLSTDAPSALPLSLKPSVSRRQNDAKLELKARRVLKTERKDKEDKGRVTDVIGGWGGESERALRKVAQRGVVKLFNAIQHSQASAVVAAEETKAARGSGKPTLPAPSLDPKSKTKNKGKHKDNPLGRGKETALDKDDFLDMIRSGGIVSKS